MEQAYEKGALTCRFALAVRRGLVNLSEQDLKVLEPAEMHFLSSYASKYGDCYIELTDPDGRVSSYIFGPVPYPNGNGVRTALVLMTAGASIASALVKGAPWIVPAALCVQSATVFALTQGGRGWLHAFNKTMPVCFERLETDITEQDYERIDRWLAKKKSSPGYFSMVFNNCTNFGVRAARMAGIDCFGWRVFRTPHAVSQKIMQLAAEGTGNPHVRVSSVLTERRAARQGPV